MVSAFLVATLRFLVTTESFFKFLSIVMDSIQYWIVSKGQYPIMFTEIIVYNF